MSFSHLFADEPSIYAATAEGSLLWYRDLAKTGLNGANAQTGWAAASGSSLGAGWVFRHLFAGGDGIIYAITFDGRLLWYRDLARNGQAVWDPASGRQIGFGWTGFDHVFSDGDGVIYAIASNGDLKWYRDDLRNGLNGAAAETGWAAASGSQIGVGWSGFRAVFPGGNGAIYVIRPDGALLWYQDLLRDGTNGAGAERGWAATSGAQIGFGWQRFTKVFASIAGDGVIYATTPEADLLWFGDLLRDGTGGQHPGLAWGDASGNAIGLGWDFRAAAESLHAYCVPGSASPGGAVALKLQADRATECEVTVLRLRENQDGTVGIPVAGPFVTTAGALSVGFEAWRTGAGWSDALVVQTDAGWPSGIYSLRCEAPGFRGTDAVFVLRPGPAQRRFLVLANTNCWNAYNDWGGRSNYTGGSGVVTLSFERPSPGTDPTAFVAGVYQPNHITAAEIWFLTWMEDAGFAADVCSDLDFHTGNPDPSGYAALILSTHPEYWSLTMAQRLQTYLAGGGNLLYLGGNGIFRSVEIAADGHTMTTSSTPDWFCGNAWPGGPKPRSLLGVAYDIAHDQLYPTRCGFVVTGADHRFFAGTGATNGAVIGAQGRNGAACGWEVDTAIDFGEGNGPPPANLQILAHGQNATAAGYTGHMTYYDTGSGGFVFAIGSITFGGSLMVDHVLQQVLRNALEASGA